MRLIYLLLLCTIPLIAQKVPDGYFKNPLEIDLKLSGNFGELRSNHFHSGLDIKTNQRIGADVHATASGYVSRIKIERYGYGKALYITHPNGYTSVYAHLNKFAPRIEAYVKERQYAQESYMLQLYPGDLDLRVDQGEIVAYSGNSGGSGGPHLHFEIRDSSAKPINPMLMGIDIPDTKAPIIKQVKVFPLTKNSTINGKHKAATMRVYMQKDGTYRTEKINAYGRIGIGINTNDSQNGSNNKNGIYEVTSSFNGSENFKVTFDTYAFNESRHINQMIDYGHFKQYKSRIMKLFIPNNSPLSLYGDHIDEGKLTLVEPGSSHTYNVVVTDLKGNASKLHIDLFNDVVADLPEVTESDENIEYADANNTFTKTYSNFEVVIPKGALYEEAELEISESSDTLKVHRDVIPLHKNMIIKYYLDSKMEDNIDQYYIARITDWGAAYYVSTRRTENQLVANTRYFANYAVTKDDLPPTVKALNFKNKQWLSKKNYLKLKIEDTGSGIDGYRATVNGKFILMEYDYKTKTLTHDFRDGVVTTTDNELKVIVTDQVGNSTTFEATFYRKS
ncbi:MAG: M23 family metallopeptidase [Nonlabens sp.]